MGINSLMSVQPNVLSGVEVGLWACLGRADLSLALSSCVLCLLATMK